MALDTLVRPKQHVSSHIFRAYDIRGRVADELTPNLVYRIGLAFGALFLSRQFTTVVLGFDGRSTSTQLASQLKKGLLDGGVDVASVGCVTSPMLYYACEMNSMPGLMVTASHNAPTDNGIKLVLAESSQVEVAIRQVGQMVQHIEPVHKKGLGTHLSIIPDYLTSLKQRFKPLPMQRPLVVDYQHSVTGIYFESLLSHYGIRHIAINRQVDGHVGDVAPDPSNPKNYQMLRQSVKQHGASLGLMFDGDGDRLGVVDETGQIIWPDRLMLLFIEAILQAHPGETILYDVKCSQLVPETIARLGGRPCLYKTGHTHMKAKLESTGAIFGGEYSGHLFFQNKWYGFDDGMVSALYLLELLSQSPKTIGQRMAFFPSYEGTPEIKIAVSEKDKFARMAQIRAACQRVEGWQINELDGVRVITPQGWFLIRPSNTSAALTFRAESSNRSALEEIQSMAGELLSEVGLSLPA